MKVLIVCSFNRGKISPFISQQTASVEKHGIYTEYFLIKGKGFFGYFPNYRKLLKQIRNFNPALIHAHYGLSGLLANFQRKVPVITSFHGSDINVPFIRMLSRISMRSSAWSVFVSEALSELAGAKRNYSVIPCGIDFQRFFPVPKITARQMLGLPENEKLILFAGSFNNKVKNYPLAEAALEIFNKSQPFVQHARMIELNGYSGEQVNLLFNACDLSLLTSFSEGSPNFIKEAMACNCPVVATDVGDIKEMFGRMEGHYLTGFDANDVADKLCAALAFSNQHPDGTSGRTRVFELGLAEDKIATKLVEVYEMVQSAKKVSHAKQ